MYIVNEDNSIYVTRGDIVLFDVAAEYNGKPYTFQVGDLVRIKVSKKKNCKEVVLEKDFPVTDFTQKVQIYLAGEDTKIGEVISKPVDYWYEVELNPLSEPQTIIGYDEDGAKVFKLFPEGADKELKEYEPTEEDLVSRYTDDELDLTSKNPIENQVVARAVAHIENLCDKTMEAVATLYITPQMFGAIGDGVADDTDALQKAVDAQRPVFIPSGTIIFIPSGRTVTINNSTTIYGAGETSVLRVAGTIKTNADKTHSLEMYQFRFECYKTNGTALIIEKENDGNPCGALSIHDMTFYNRNNVSSELDNAIMSVKGIRESNILNCSFRGDSPLYGKAIVMNADETHQTTNVNITGCNFYYIGTFVELTNTEETYVYLAGIRFVNNTFIGGTNGIRAIFVDTLWVTDSMFDFVANPLYLDSCGTANISDNYLQTQNGTQCVYICNNSKSEKRFIVVKRNALWSTNGTKSVDGIVFDGVTSKIGFSEVCGNKSTGLNRMVVMKNCQNCKVLDNVAHNSNTFFDGNNDSTIVEIKHNHVDDTVTNFNTNTNASCHLADGNRHGVKLFHKYGKEIATGDGTNQTIYITHGMAKTPVWAQATSGSYTYPILAVAYNETAILVTFEKAIPNGSQVVINWEARASLL